MVTRQSRHHCRDASENATHADRPRRGQNWWTKHNLIFWVEPFDLERVVSMFILSKPCHGPRVKHCGSPKTRKFERCGPWPITGKGVIHEGLAGDLRVINRRTMGKFMAWWLGLDLGISMLMSGFLKGRLIMSRSSHELGCSWACSTRSEVETILHYFMPVILFVM